MNPIWLSHIFSNGLKLNHQLVVGRVSKSHLRCLQQKIERERFIIPKHFPCMYTCYIYMNGWFLNSKLVGKYTHFSMGSYYWILSNCQGGRFSFQVSSCESNYLFAKCIQNHVSSQNPTNQVIFGWYLETSWWFQIFFIFIPTGGDAEK